MTATDDALVLFAEAVNDLHLWVGLWADEMPFREASGPNYSRQRCTNWSTPESTDRGARTTAAPVAFPRVGSAGWGDISGFFLTTAKTGGTTLNVERFDDMTTIESGGGDRITVTPYWTFSQ